VLFKIIRFENGAFVWDVMKNEKSTGIFCAYGFWTQKKGKIAHGMNIAKNDAMLSLKPEYSQ